MIGGRKISQAALDALVGGIKYKYRARDTARVRVLSPVGNV